MAVFRVQAPDGSVIRIDAADRDTALRGAQEYYASRNPAPDTVAGVVARGVGASAPASAPRGVLGNIAGGMAIMNEAIPLGDEFRDAVVTPFHMSTDAWRSPGDFVREAGRAWNEVRAHQHGLAQGFEETRPKAANLIRGATTGATIFVPVAGEAAVYANSSRAANMLRGATTAGLTAAGYAAADRGTAQERLAAASRAAIDPVTLSLGAAAGALAPATPRKPKPKVSPEVNLLRDEGVPITWGRQGGKVGSALEDAATSVPFAGDMIAARQRESLESFNKAVANRALKPIGESLPEDIPAGRAAVKYAGDKLSAAYDKVLPELGVRLDRDYATQSRAQLAPILETMSPESQSRLLDIIDKRVHGPFNDGVDAGILSGDRYKLVERGLDFEIGRFGKSQDPDQQAIAEGLKVVKGALDEAASRQNPKFAAAKDAIDLGWATLVQMENATTRGGATEDGVFTARQYDAAVKAGDPRIRRRGYARGEALNQDLASAGVKVLAPKIPDSGTARRGAQMAMGGGGVVAAVTNPAAVVGPAAGVGALAAAYSRRGQELANALLDGRLSAQAAEAARAELAGLAAKDPQVAVLYQQVSERLSRLAGAEPGSRGSPPPGASVP